MADITPYTTSITTSNSPIVSLNYTNQDFWSMKTRLINFMNERFGPNGTVLPNTFNDLVEGSIAIMLMEVWSFLADTLSFKMDQNVNEIFIDTVTEVDNAFRLAKLIGFTPQPPIAARTMWVATLNNPILTDIFIPTPLSVDVVSNDLPITIELFPADSDNNPILDDDIIIPAGASANRNIIGLEGKSRSDLFTGTGDVGQTYQLANAPVIWDSIRVIVDGTLWDQVEFFTDSQPRKEYRVEFDASWNAFIIFGNNRAGLIPSNSSQIQVKYRVGGGTIGNITTGYVQTQTQVQVVGLGYPVPISLTNYTKGEFGYNGDGIEDIRKKLPLWVRTQDRAVSGDDYKILSEQFATPYHGQIGKAVAALRNHGCSGNIVDLYVLAKENDDSLTEAGNDLKVDLNNTLNQKKMLTDFVCIKDGIIVWVDVQVDVTMDKFYRKFSLEYNSNIKARIDNFFSLNSWDYGQSLKDTDLVRELSDIKEIKDITVTFIRHDTGESSSIVTTNFNEIIRPDGVDIAFNYV